MGAGGSKSDFRLIVGADINQSIQNLRNDIQQIVSAVSKDPIKINIEYNVSKASSKLAEETKKAANNINKESSARNANLKAQRAEIKAQKEYYSLISKVDKAIVSTTQHLNKWTAASTGKSAESYKGLKQELNALQSIRQELSSTTKLSDDIKSRAAGSLNNVATYTNSIKMAGENTVSVFDRLNNLGQKFGLWLTASSMVLFAVRTLKQMVAATSELDHSMSQLQIVTRVSSEEMKSYGDSVAEVSQKLGVAVNDMVSSTTTYARLGYSINESLDLAKYTAMLQAVGDIDASAAQDAMTSIIKAFNIDASKADAIEAVADKLVTTGNNFPISVSQIAEGMNNASSALAAAGNTFDESVALLTAANTTIQNASKSSTGLRTISARLRNTKAELDELGEVMTKSKYQELIQMLSRNQISLFDPNTGDYRSTYAIIKDIAEIWDTLSKKEQAAMATEIAGVRQQAVFFSLVGQFKEASGALDKMASSSGAAKAAMEIHVNSIAGRTEQLKNKFIELSTSVATKDLIIDVIDLGKGLLDILKILTKIINLVGGIKTVLGVGAGFLGVKSLLKLLSGEKELTGFLGQLQKARSIFMEIPKDAGSGLSRLNTALSMAGVSMSSFVLTATAVAAAIGVITLAISAYQKAEAERHANNQKSISDFNESSTRMSEILKARAEYEKYSNIENRSTEDEHRFQSAIEGVTAAIGDKASALAGLTVGSKEYNKALEKLTNEELKDLSRKARKAKTAAIDELGRGSVSIPVKYVSAVKNAAPELYRIGMTRSSDGSNHLLEYHNAQEAAKYLEVLKAIREAAEQNGETETAYYKQISDQIDTVQPKLNEVLKATYEQIEADYIQRAGIPKTKEEFQRMYQTMRGGMADLGDEAMSYIDTQMSANEQYATWMQEIVAVNEEKAKSFKELDDAILGVSEGFGRATAAGEEYKKALEAPEKDDNFKSYVEAFKLLNDEFARGTTNSNKFWASAEYIFGEAQLEKWGWSDGLEKIYEAMERNVAIFSDAETQGEGFVSVLHAMADEAGQITASDGSILGTLKELSEGGYSIDIDYSDIPKLAEEMGLSEEAILSCLQAIDMWGDIDFADVEQVAEKLIDTGLAAKFAGKEIIAVDELRDHLRELGLSAADIHKLEKRLKELGDITLISPRMSADELKQSLSELKVMAEDGVNVYVDYNQLIEMSKAVGFTKEETIETAKKLAELDNVVFTNQLSSGTGGATDLKSVLGVIQDTDFDNTESGANSMNAVFSRSEQILRDILHELQVMNGTAVTARLTIHTEGLERMKEAARGLGSITSYGNVSRAVGRTTRQFYASGTKSAIGGYALTGEAGEELVQSGDKAYFVGTHGAELVYLNYGDRVYNASETKRIKNKTRLSGTFPSFASGGIYGTLNRRTWGSLLNGGQSSSASGSSYSSSSGRSSSDSSEKKAESEFEKLYKYHQHLLAMDAESVQSYLNWLNSAYQEAYRKGEIDLDGFRKYQEEVYSKLQGLFKDYLSDVEHEISMRENFEGEGKKILALYKMLLADVEKEVKAAHAAGLKDTDDYVQALQSKWASYRKSIKKLEEDATKDSKSAIDKLIDIRAKMLKDSLEKEKKNIDDRLKQLKEFYDRQKELLNKADADDKYFKEQAEKRKKVAALQEKLTQLEHDNSAWAQKRKVELIQELADAQSELDEFEKEHALKLAQEKLDSLSEMQTKELESQSTALDEQANNNKSLYERALADIRSGSTTLYQEMIQWNSEYGDGIDATIKSAWEEAYKALLNYHDLYNKHYEGIKLQNATGYVRPKESWDKAPVSKTGSHSSPTSSSGRSASSGGRSSAPSLSYGSSVTVKKSATRFSSWSGNAYMASFVPGGSYTVYQTAGDQVLIGRGGVYTGWVKRSDIVGYATGTQSASRGIHSIDELGTETIFSSKDGNKYKMFTGGEKVLNAKATDFLYKFATSGGRIFEAIINTAIGDNTLSSIRPIINNNNINMGDVIVNGNADSYTVSEIRRAKRDNLTEMLQAFNKLNLK